jgi:hypothetical protein
MTLGMPGVSLDDGMYCLANLNRSVTNDGPLFRRQLGPFCRHVLILTVLRGIVGWGQGEPKGGYVTRRWVLANKEGPRPPTDQLERHQFVVAAYTKILNHVGSAFGDSINIASNTEMVPVYRPSLVEASLGP